ESAAIRQRVCTMSSDKRSGTMSCAHPIPLAPLRLGVRAYATRFSDWGVPVSGEPIRRISRKDAKTPCDKGPDPPLDRSLACGRAKRPGVRRVAAALSITPPRNQHRNGNRRPSRPETSGTLSCALAPGPETASGVSRPQPFPVHSPRSFSRHPKRRAAALCGALQDAVATISTPRKPWKMAKLQWPGDYTGHAITCVNHLPAPPFAHRRCKQAPAKRVSTPREATRPAVLCATLPRHAAANPRPGCLHPERNPDHSDRVRLTPNTISTPPITKPISSGSGTAATLSIHSLFSDIRVASK